jgi:hypothetical protein
MTTHWQPTMDQLRGLAKKLRPDFDDTRLDTRPVTADEIGDAQQRYYDLTEDAWKASLSQAERADYDSKLLTRGQLEARRNDPTRVFQDYEYGRDIADPQARQKLMGVPRAAPGVRTVSQGTPQFPDRGLNWLRTLFRGGQPPPARHAATLPGAPPFPSGQTFQRLLPSQRAAFQSRVKGLGVPWQDYEAQMMAQRPTTRRQPGQTFRIAPNVVRP